MTALQMAEIAALVGDPARANILSTLFDGRALTATELSFAARVTPQTASGHLAKMTQAGLLTVLQQGRHRYYRLASPMVAQMLESIIAVAAAAPPRHRPRTAQEDRLRVARTCYDHFAGKLGVSIADALCDRKHVILSDDGGEVTESGLAFLKELGASFPAQTRRPFCRHCLDWTERRFTCRASSVRPSPRVVSISAGCAASGIRARCRSRRKGRKASAAVLDSRSSWIRRRCCALS